MKRAILFAVAGLLVSGVASADTLDKADTAWLLTSTALVLFMTLPGLALFYGGLVGRRNVLSVLMQCFTIAGIVTFLWVIVQYSLAFSDGGAMNQWVGGFGSAFLAGVTIDSLSGTAPETIFIAFQLTFAIITCALIVGGFAERMQFSAMVLFSILWSLLVYAPICHWVWGGGWLADMGFLDFAGGAVVHLTAGVGALVAAMVLGSRTGFPQKPMPPHSLPLTVAGAGMLWVGWFGFNGGSALAADGAAAMALLVTHIGASAGAMGWMAMEWIKFGKPSVLGVVTGMVAGLGTITPASGFVGPIGAMIIGLAAGVVCFYATRIIKRVLVIDDSLDVFPVHGVGGSLGLLLCAVFVNANLGGAGYAEGMNLGSQLGVQAIGLLATFAWTAVATWVILKVVGLITPLRVSEEDEIEGLDLTQHEERGYSR
ncbi:MAG: ammonium transporter [Gammaproteobacteria bacterium]|nr:ammonium transporter [Gammaproteobacteria bacterium]MXW45987.1 ammonium transporter [Gammaproteobacteria bacterium]MYD02450.1 ammonium transporter [Gammaproteobacteria bacterium]MYI25936.1 ammonium transporter [Gammaproteobacteria bacterium]